MTLVQIHTEDKITHRTEFVAQHEVSDVNDCRAWVKDIQGRFPLPEGSQWVLLLEGEPRFLMASQN